MHKYTLDLKIVSPSICHKFKCKLHKETKKKIKPEKYKKKNASAKTSIQYSSLAAPISIRFFPPNVRE